MRPISLFWGFTMLVVFNLILKIMFSKLRIISTFASFVIIYFFPWIFYAYLAVDFFESQMITDVSRGDDMLLLPLTIGCLIMAYLFSSIYEKWGLGSYIVRSGIQFGVLIGLFLDQVLILSCTEPKCRSLRLDIQWMLYFGS